MKSFKKNLRRRSGQGMTEYIIIVGLIAILLVAAVTKFKNALQNAYTAGAETIQTKITDEIK
jgi:Flp pilus assembly pilin Flp